MGQLVSTVVFVGASCHLHRGSPTPQTPTMQYHPSGSHGHIAKPSRSWTALKSDVLTPRSLEPEAADHLKQKTPRSASAGQVVALAQLQHGDVSAAHAPGQMTKTSQSLNPNTNVG